MSLVKHTVGSSTTAKPPGTPNVDQDRFRALYDAAPIGVYLSDADGRCVYVNQRYCELTGLARAAALGDGWIRSLHPDDRHWVFAEWQSARKAGRRSVAEFRLQLPDNSIRWVQGEAVPWRVDDTQSCNYLVTIQDVTKSREAANRLEQQLRFREFVSRLSAEFIRVGPDDFEAEVVKALRAIVEYTGVDRVATGRYSVDDRFVVFTHEVQAAGVRVPQREVHDPHCLSTQETPFTWYWRQALAGANIMIPDVAALPAEARAERDDFRKRSVKSVLHVSMNVTERATGFILLESRRLRPDWDREFVAQMEFVAQIFGNALERNRAEQAQRASDEQYRMIFSKSVDGIIILDLEGRVVEANPAFCEMLGYQRDELLCLSPQEFIHPDSHHLFEEFRAALSAGRSYFTEAKDIHKDGSVIDIEVSGRLMPYQGQPHLVGIVRDIRRRRQTENKLHEQQTMLAHVSRLSTMGELVAEIAHEVNQPFYSIANCSRALRNALAADSPDLELAQECADQIDLASQLGGAMIKRLRNFVRRQEPNLQTACLNTIVREAVLLMDFEICRHCAHVELDLDPALPPISAEPIQMQQVIVNLLRNACEAMKQVDIGNREICCCTLVDDGRVCLTVSDRGPGVLTEAVATLFDAFKSTKPDGLGMGLAISKSILESHGGSIEYRRGASARTVFRISLPLALADIDQQR